MEEKERRGEGWRRKRGEGEVEGGMGDKMERKGQERGVTGGNFETQCCTFGLQLD